MLTFAVRLMMALATLAFATSSSADTIVDTGTPDGNPTTNWAFADWQYFAGEFSTSTSYVVQSVEGYFSNFSGTAGQVTVGIHTDGGTKPGALLFSSSVDLAGDAPLGWWGVSVNQLLGPGTYWASFIPSATVNGAMPGTAPNPLQEYALGNVNGWVDVSPDVYDFVAVGVRINGELLAVPDSTSTLQLMCMVGLVAIFALRWRANAA